MSCTHLQRDSESHMPTTWLMTRVCSRQQRWAKGKEKALILLGSGCQVSLSHFGKTAAIVALSKASAERSSSKHCTHVMVTPGWVFWWCLCRTARERRFRLPHCPLEILLGQWGVGTCLPKLENILCQLAASVRGLFPDLQFVIATCQWNQTSECVLAAHKCCKHHYMVLFVSLVEFFCPQLKTWSRTCLLYSVEM